MRAHYSAPIQSPAGDLQGGATVSVFARGTTQGGTQLGTLTTLPLYADASSGTLLTNPFITTTGAVSFYLPLPARFDLGIQVPGQAQVFFPDVSAGVPSLVPTVVTASYTILLSDQLIMASAASGNIVLTLPAATAEFQVVVKRTDSSANTLSVAPPAGGQLDNAGTAITLAALAKTRLYCDGTKYWTI
jgi:hypothetical protein